MKVKISEQTIASSMRSVVRSAIKVRRIRESMNRKSLRHAVGPVSFALVVLVCWLVSGMIADRMVQQELDAALRAQRQMSSSIVDNMAEVIASDLSMARAIPATMAELNVVQQALAHSQAYAVNTAAPESALRNALLKVPELSTVSGFLHDAQGFSGLDSIWLVNANGVCVASSNEQSRGFVGIDMRTRNYLSNALLGAFGEAYGVGGRAANPAFSSLPRPTTTACWSAR
jgi:C4-dicarboxylate-specific signal transduction histidine kinase